MAKSIDPNAKFNLSQATILILDRSAHSADVVVQILTGFGVRKFLRCQTVKEAVSLLGVNTVDLLIVDPELEDEDGFEFVRWLRRSNSDNKYAPVMLATGHTNISGIKHARDTGANFVVAKPMTPTTLVQRIHWIAADKRQFVDVNNGSYIGPDRRFKYEGPPIGSDGRRSTDLSAELGEATGANMSADEISSMFKPQKVAI